MSDWRRRSLDPDWRSKPQPMTGWVPPKDAPVRIVCAACRVGDTILAGARHGDVVMISQADAAGIERLQSGEDQGFIDQFGRYWNRREAWLICGIEGQSVDVERNGGEGLLYSEGLY